MNPKCYKSAISSFLGRSCSPNQFGHIESGLGSSKPAGILSLLAIEAPILFQPVIYRFEGFNRISPARYKKFGTQSPLRIH
jgi:hypothetical protein